MQEVWKEITGCNIKYWISNLGRIKSEYHGETIMRPSKDRLGYLKVGLSVGKKRISFLVHRLVALYFIPNPRHLNEINHIDGNKENNCVDNLEWCTRKENMQHASRTGLLTPPPSGEENLNSKVFFQFDFEGNLIKIWKGISEAAKKLLELDPNVQKEYTSLENLRGNLSATLNKRRKSCCGYIFSFEPEINVKDYEKNWGANSITIEATDKKTGEKFTFKSIRSMDGYVMPNGQKVQATMICKTCKGKRKSHGGYYWRYL